MSSEDGFVAKFYMNKVFHPVLFNEIHFDLKVLDNIKISYILLAFRNEKKTLVHFAFVYKFSQILQI